MKLPLHQDKTQPDGDPIYITSGIWTGGITWDFFGVKEGAILPELELCTAGFCIVTYRGKLVIVEHKTRGFELPGGHVNPSESLEDTVRREIWEEVGAKITSPQYFGYKRVSPPVPVPHRDDPTKFYPFPHSYVPYFIAEAVEMTGTELTPDVVYVHLATLEEAYALFAADHNHDQIVRYALQDRTVEVIAR
jgi:8-oxo-dGTP diphosphatase